MLNRLVLHITTKSDLKFGRLKLGVSTYCVCVCLLPGGKPKPQTLKRKGSPKPLVISFSLFPCTGVSWEGSMTRRSGTKKELQVMQGTLTGAYTPQWEILSGEFKVPTKNFPVGSVYSTL
jgi:hypothetical protein